MDARFTISADRAMGAIRIAMAGFFTESDVAAFISALRTKLVELGRAPNEHLMLCDVSGMKIQAQDIVGAFGQIVGNPAYRSRRLAFLTGSSLSRMQAQRLTDRPGVRFFTDQEAAEAWLFGDEAELAIGMPVANGAGNGNRTRITSLEG